MTEVLFRAGALDGHEGRTVYGTAVPFGQIAEVRDGGGRPYLEGFEKGAFARSIAERGGAGKIKLWLAHDTRRLPVGVATQLQETVSGLAAAFLIPESRDGDDALNLIRGGVVDAFSIGFRPIKQRTVNGVTIRTEVALIEVSLVGSPAYAGALIGGVRAFSDIKILDHEAVQRRFRLIELNQIARKI